MVSIFDIIPIWYLIIALVWAIPGYFLVKKSFEDFGGADNGSLLELVYYVAIGLAIGFFWILTLPVFLIAFIIKLLGKEDK